VTVLRRRRVAGSVIVVIGATSGVGRVLARSLAVRQAQLVLVARNESDVCRVVAECEALGATVLGAAADIGRSDDVDRVLSAAVERFGRIDTWINTAANLIVGWLEDQPVDEIEALIATNVRGTTLSSRAAMGHFTEHGTGVLVNVSSMLGMVPNPVVPTYVMSKFAVRGLTLSLHAATRFRSSIRVCLVLPGPIDTPMFQRAANHTGRAIRSIPPAASPDRVAATVIRSVERPRRQRTVGLTGALIMVGVHVVPRFTSAVVAAYSARMIFERKGTTGATPGTLFRSEVPARGSGDWRRGRIRVRVGDAVGRRLARR
jgi:short-subunit dehydrogenase